MRVGLWQERFETLWVDLNPQYGDVVVDLPKQILDRYDRISREWIQIQSELKNFSREQDREEEYERLH